MGRDNENQGQDKQDVYVEPDNENDTDETRKRGSRAYTDEESENL